MRRLAEWSFKNTDWTRESTMVFKPGTIATVLSARSTLRVLSTDKLPNESINIVAYLKE